MQLLKFFKNKKIKLWLIIGMLNNKDLFEYLKILKPILYGVVAISIPGEKNSFKPLEIIKVCKKLKINSFKKPSIDQANNFLVNQIKTNTILVSGSLYLVGKIRKNYL
jgi:folylpolyglutamate synthase/dihydropteroate synthase